MTVNIQYYEGQIAKHERAVALWKENIHSAEREISRLKTGLQSLEKENELQAFWDKYDPNAEIRGLIEHTSRRIDACPSMLSSSSRSSSWTVQAAAINGQLIGNLARQEKEHGKVILTQRSLLHAAMFVLRDDRSVGAPEWRRKIESKINEITERARAIS